ncbi:hypothetical protein OJ253_2745 [Cryptosporidium canis]|uniref:Uncharacterized protein n=1 Tax=Cryptosporidium canis TaxID=195482 RepID=A0A9D5DEX1_9CRYT|nr:hypothetical protein OJ253_2745 [Cryptosporidium canis]
MKETYIEIAFQIGKSWEVITKFITRSLNVISNLLATLELHLSDEILSNHVSEETLQSSRFIVINDLSTRIKKLSAELNGYVEYSFKEHLSNLERTIKWINDEYSTFNHFNSDKNSELTSMKRVQVLHSSLKLCTLVRSDYNLVWSLTSAIEENMDCFIQHKLIKPSAGNSPSSSKLTESTLFEQFSKVKDFHCYNCQPELAVISKYLDRNKP